METHLSAFENEPEGSVVVHESLDAVAIRDEFLLVLQPGDGGHGMAGDLAYKRTIVFCGHMVT